MIIHNVMHDSSYRTLFTFYHRLADDIKVFDVGAELVVDVRRDLWEIRAVHSGEVSNWELP